MSRGAGHVQRIIKKLMCNPHGAWTTLPCRDATRRNCQALPRRSAALRPESDQAPNDRNKKPKHKSIKTDGPCAPPNCGATQAGRGYAGRTQSLSRGWPARDPPMSPVFACRSIPAARQSQPRQEGDMGKAGFLKILGRARLQIRPVPLRQRLL
jgi:hypothetical protein